jgi:tRNA modification GTPase
MVAMLTPAGRGAVATVVVDGPRATDCVAAHYQAHSGQVHGGGSLAAMAINRISVGRFGLVPGEGAPGEEIVVCRRGERRIELHCHGGEVAAATLIARMVDEGCEPCDWQTWLDHSTPNLIAAEALVALAGANTARTAGVLLAQYHGALEQTVRDLIDQLAAGDDAPVSDIARQLDTLIARYRWGQHLTVPWRVVIAGRPNVGKSSLINRIVGYERALVFDQPGTTRDVVWAATAIDGWPVELADTAGLRSGAGTIESLGIERARAQIAAADLVVLVHDASEPNTEETLSLEREWPDALLVANKIDLANKIDVSEQRRRLDVTATSALTGKGIGTLLAQIAVRLLSGAVETTDAWCAQAVPFTARQYDCLATAGAALAAQPAVAIGALRQLVGENASRR